MTFRKRLQALLWNRCKVLILIGETRRADAPFREMLAGVVGAGSCICLGIKAFPFLF